MKKFFIVVAILLMAGSVLVADAFAADANEGTTREAWAMGKGRAVVSDSSAVLRVWYTGTGTATVGVSDTTALILTENGSGTTVDTSSTSYDTLKEIEAYIDSLDSWEASIGPDGYGSYNPTLLASAQAAAGVNEQAPTYIYQDSSTSKDILVGVPATVGKFNRIKSFTNRVAGTGSLTLSVYDGDTKVWETVVGRTAYNTATSPLTSPNTIDFGTKGIAGGMGKSMVVKASCATTLGDVSAKTADCNVAIEYDQF